MAALPRRLTKRSRGSSAASAAAYALRSSSVRRPPCVASLPRGALSSSPKKALAALISSRPVSPSTASRRLWSTCSLSSGRTSGMSQKRCTTSRVSESTPNEKAVSRSSRTRWRARPSIFSVSAPDAPASSEPASSVAVAASPCFRFRLISRSCSRNLRPCSTRFVGGFGAAAGAAAGGAAGAVAGAAAAAAAFSSVTKWRAAATCTTARQMTAG